MSKASLKAKHDDRSRSIRAMSQFPILGVPINILSSFHPLCNPLSAPFPPSDLSGCSSTPPAPSSSLDSLAVLYWNARDLCTKSAKLFHSILFHLIDLLCIRNLKSYYSFRIPGYSAARCDRTHSLSVILKLDFKVLVRRTEMKQIGLKQKMPLTEQNGRILYITFKEI